MRLRGGEAWRATHTPQGPATVHLVMSDGVVDVDAWGAGAAWAAENAPALCGEEDDDSGFQPHEPALADAKRRHPGLRIPKTRAVFEVLLPTVIGQKVATDAAHESYRRLVYELGTVAPGPANPRVAWRKQPGWHCPTRGSACRRSRASVHGQRPRSRLWRSATPTRCPSATTTCRTWSATRSTARRARPTSECWKSSSHSVLIVPGSCGCSC